MHIYRVLTCTTVTLRNGPKRAWRRQTPQTPAVLDRRIVDHHHITFTLHGSDKNMVKKLLGVSIHGQQISLRSTAQVRYILECDDTDIGLPRWYQPTEVIHYQEAGSMEKQIKAAVLGEPAQDEPDEITSDDGLHWKPVRQCD